jgi:hypothetical protein
MPAGMKTPSAASFEKPLMSDMNGNFNNLKLAKKCR